MSLRSSIVILGTSALVLASGCESAKEQQREVDEATREAQAEVNAARTEAAQETAEARAEADRKIASAQEDFSHMREEFLRDIRTKLVSVEKDVDEIKAKANTATGKQKASLEAGLPKISEKRTEFDRAMTELGQASAATWDDAKAHVEKKYGELKDLVEDVDDGT